MKRKLVDFVENNRGKVGKDIEIDLIKDREGPAEIGDLLGLEKFETAFHGEEIMVLDDANRLFVGHAAFGEGPKNIGDAAGRKL